MNAPATIAIPPAPARLLMQHLRDELPILSAALGLIVLCLALFAIKGIYFGPGIILGNAQVFFVSGTLMVTLDAAWHLWRKRPDSPVEALKARYLSAQQKARLVAGLPMLTLMIAFMPFFSKMKSTIPLFNDYTWDATFIGWDRALFLGHDAWQVLQPVFGTPLVTAFLALLYHLWMLLIYPGGLFFALFPIDRDIRRRYFFSFLLSWTLIGGVAATAFASVGPCFLEPLMGDARFAPQMAYLNAANEQVPVMTLTVQQMLLDWFHTDAQGLGSGITAMPSMHIAMALIFWLAIRQVSRRAGWFFFAFFIAIFIGSVHLAYHYAVDGLVSIAMASAIWWASKPLFTWWDRVSARRNERKLAAA